VSDFQDNCTGCGICKEACPFLAEYGTPDEILTTRPEASFYCASCRRCDSACPLELSPSTEFAATKERLVLEGRIPQPVCKALDGARGFAKAGHGFPFSFYKSAETVFWPGCALAASRPGLVSEICSVLGSRLQKNVGLALDCCFDPVHGFGDTDTSRAALREINKRLHDRKVKTVITGCLNCYKLLSRYLEGIEVAFILDVLPAECFKNKWDGMAYLHHPCPSSHWDGIMNSARGVFLHLQRPTKDLQADTPVFAEAPCCGNGGGLSSTSLELADRFLQKIIEKADGNTLVTYCAGCQNRFLKRGIKAVHLLEGLSSKAPREKVSSPLTQWANRFVLAMKTRLETVKFWLGILLLVLIAAGIGMTRQHGFSAEGLTDLFSRYPVAAPLIFLCIYSVAPSLFLPSIPLTLAAGFFWGPVWGVIFSITGATLGACLPFFLSRYLFQNAVKAKIPEDRWNWLQNKVNLHGWKAVAFTRLIPVFPFNLLNYLFGLTPIPFRHYLWSTFVFMLPACIAFVAFGSSLGELILRGNIRGLIIGIVVAVCAFLIPVALRPFFRKIGEGQTDGSDDEKNKSGK